MNAKLARLHWLVNRLRAMGPAEVLHRLHEHALKSVAARKAYTFFPQQGKEIFFNENGST